MKMKGHEATKANTPHIAQKQIFILDKKLAKVYKKAWAEAKRGKKNKNWLLCHFYGIYATKVLVVTPIKQKEGVQLCKAT